MPFKTFAALMVLTALLAQISVTGGAKILAVYSYSAKSHYMMHNVIIKELLNHGHEITMITARTLEPKKMGANYTEILIEPEFDYWKHIQNTLGVNNHDDLANDIAKLMKATNVLGIGTTEHALKQPKVQAIINAKQTKGVYDLLLVEQFYQEAFLALAHVYDVPVISTATFAQQNFMSQMFGLITPWSYVPTGYAAFTDHMSFCERVQNTYQALRLDLHLELTHFPTMDELVHKYFGHLAINLPTTSDMNRNLSAMLINSYTPIAVPAPIMHNMINVGGMHIYPSKALPNDIQNFLDGAAHGAIYFSLGTQVQSKDLPMEKIQIFLDVFRTIKQRVLWKFENDTIRNLPSNVMLKKWMPQNDILPHPNVRAFIAHGGLFGTQEAIYHGVPIVGIPFFFDQFLNIKKCVLGGYAVDLDIHTLTREDLKNALHKIIYTPKYRETMKRMSQIFRDRPMGPRETVVYWVDYVIRHKGARHLRAAGLDLSWYQFYLLDVIALFVAAAAVLLGIVYMMARCIWRWFCSKQSKCKVQ